MSTELVAARLGAGQYALPLEQACIRYGIVTAMQKSHFLAQIATESAGFTAVRESLNYSVAGLLATFGRHRISRADAERCGRREGHRADQPAIANLVYGGAFGLKNLGNTKPGDGWAFIGRSLKQITGRYNYTKYSMDTYGDLRAVENPEMLETAPDVAFSAGWFWRSRNLNAVADTDDLEAVTRIVNGGLNGLDSRRVWLAKAKFQFLSILE